MPALMPSSCRIVIASPSGMPAMKCPRRSSSESLPSSTSWSTTVAVNVLVMLAMRKWSARVIGAAVARSPMPAAIVQVPRPGTQTPTRAPGVEVSANAVSTICVSCSCTSSGNASSLEGTGVAAWARTGREGSGPAVVASPRPPARSARRIIGTDVIGVDREPEYAVVISRSPPRRWSRAHRACDAMPEAYVIRALTAPGSGDGADWHQTGRPFMKPVLGTGFKIPPTRGGLFRLVEDRWEVGTRRLVVKPDAHQRHEEHDPQPVLQAPCEQRAVADRHEDAGSLERPGRSNHGLEVFGRLAHGVAEECGCRGVAGDPAVVFHDDGTSLRDRVAQLAGTIVAVHTKTDIVARRQVGLGG